METRAKLMAAFEDFSMANVSPEEMIETALAQAGR